MSDADHAQVIFDALGEGATYDDGTSTSEVTVILERGVQVWQGNTVIRQDFVSLLHSEVTPEAGHTVTAGGETWTLTNRDTDDGAISRWEARRQ